MEANAEVREQIKVLKRHIHLKKAKMDELLLEVDRVKAEIFWFEKEKAHLEDTLSCLSRGWGNETGNKLSSQSR